MDEYKKRYYKGMALGIGIPFVTISLLAGISYCWAKQRGGKARVSLEEDKEEKVKDD